MGILLYYNEVKYMLITKFKINNYSFVNKSKHFYENAFLIINYNRISYKRAISRCKCYIFIDIRLKKKDILLELGNVLKY